MKEVNLMHSKHLEIPIPGTRKTFLVPDVPPEANIGWEIRYAGNFGMVTLKVVRVYSYLKNGWNTRYLCEVYEYQSSPSRETSLQPVSDEECNNLVRDLEERTQASIPEESRVIFLNC